MFENLTYKQKFIGLLLVAILLGFTAYKRSFKLTIDAYQEYQNLNKELAYMNNSSNGIEVLDNEILFFDNLIGGEYMEPELVQQEILNFVSHKKTGVQVVNVAEIHKNLSDNFFIYTNQLTIEGSFNQLLQMTYAFEKKFKYSRVISIDFFKKRDYKTRRIKLYTKIIFQNYEKK